MRVNEYIELNHNWNWVTLDKRTDPVAFLYLNLNVTGIALVEVVVKPYEPVYPHSIDERDHTQSKY